MLGNPFRAVGIPFFIDDYLPFRQIGQHVIRLPWLKHLRLGFGLQDTASSCGRSIPGIVVEPTTDALHPVKSAHHRGIIKDRYLVILIAFILRCQFNRTCFVDFFLRWCGHWPLFSKLFDNVWEKFFCSGPSLICFDKLSFVCFKPGMLFFISPRSARHPEWVEDGYRGNLMRALFVLLLLRGGCRIFGLFVVRFWRVCVFTPFYVDENFNLAPFLPRTRHDQRKRYIASIYGSSSI